MVEDAQRIESENIQKEKELNLLLFKEPTFIDDKAFLARFGINIPKPESAPRAYVKLYQHDFIVEEIDSDRLRHTIARSSEKPEAYDDASISSWSCTLVKCGVTTIEAIKDIAAQLGIQEANISFAGIKDKQAITAQRIAIKNAAGEDIARIKSNMYFLKDIKPFKGALNQGSLIANRFSLRLRFNEVLSEHAKKDLSERIDMIAQEGYYNFFYLQRFGVPRFLSHVWGLYILQGNEKALIDSVLFEDSANELEFFRELRKTASGFKNDLGKVREIYGRFPVYLAQENALIDALRKNGSIDFFKIKSYAQLWANAFASLLWNELLTQGMQHDDMPRTLPLVFTHNPSIQAMYRPYLEFLNMRNIKSALDKVSFVLMQDKEIETKAHVSDISYAFSEKFMDISFTLPKGSYATCFLSHFIDIVSGTPLADTYTDYGYDSFPSDRAETCAFFKERIENAQYRSDK